MRSNIVFIIFLLFFSLDLFAQHTNVHLGNSYNLLHEKKFLTQDYHTSFKPLVKSVVNFKKDIFLESESNSWFNRKLFNEHLVIIDTQDYYFTASPIIHFELGKEQSSGEKFKNTRGFLLEGSIGDRVSFQTSFMENQASFPNYIDIYVRKNLVIPGQGYKRDFKSDAFDYAMASGYVSIKPAKSFIIQFGHGKHFIGDGYRSLLLSDISFNYPFLRVQTNIGKIQYTNLYTEFQDIRNPLSYETGFAKKYMSSHHLSYNISKQFNISFYESVIWRINHAPGNNGFDFNYLNPIIFFRPVEYSINSPDNVLMGLNAKYQVLEEAYVYSQFVLDEFSLTSMREGKNWWGNKYGYQLGIKSYNTLKISDLTFQAEYNIVRPYTYAHHNPSQNYAHYNQPLAHPLGANFDERRVLSIPRACFGYSFPC